MRGQHKIHSGNIRGPIKIYNRINFADEIPTPQIFQDAVSCKNLERWKNEMNKEYSSLQENNTWCLVDLPHGKKAIGSKWVYNLKKDKEGKITRFKARV